MVVVMVEDGNDGFDNYNGATTVVMMLTTTIMMVMGQL